MCYISFMLTFSGTLQNSDTQDYIKTLAQGISWMCLWVKVEGILAGERQLRYRSVTLGVYL